MSRSCVTSKLKVNCDVHYFLLQIYQQFDESGCDIATPSATGSNRIFIENTHRKRSLAIEICNQQHLRCHGGSLPSSFRSADLPVPLSGASPARYRRTRSVTPRIHAVSANGNLGSPRANGLESIPSSVNTQSEITNSLPMSSEVQNIFSFLFEFLLDI